MKIMFDFFLVILFFITYKLAGFYTATFVIMIGATVQLAIMWLFMQHKIDNMYWLTYGMIMVLGAITLMSRNEVFFKWKPTAINWTLALLFLGSHFIGHKPWIQRMMEKNVVLPEPVWRRLNGYWIAFFLLMGTANLFVVYNFSTTFWVNFKLFGVLGLTFLFVIVQAIYLSKHIDEKAFK